MSRLKFIGIDPSMSNLGMCRGWIDLDTLEWEVEELNLQETKPVTSKTVRKSSLDYDRARELFEAQKEFAEGADFAFAEMPIGSQSAMAMKGYGMCIMLIASLDIPLIQVSPSEVKWRAVKDKNATKEEMIAWAVRKFPDINWLRRGQKVLGKNEHLADSIGAVNAGIMEDDFTSLVTMMRKMTASLTK